MRRSRKLIAFTAAVAVVAGLGVAVATDAFASVTSPTNGSTVRGTITLTESPGGSESYFCNGRTYLWLMQGSTQLASWSSGSGGTLNASVRTENYPNGTYVVHGQEQDGDRHWYGTCYTHNQRDYYNTIYISNTKTVAYTGDTAGTLDQPITVSAKVYDPNDGNKLLSGQQVNFALSGGPTVSATTNGSGVASATLTLNAPARTATLNVSSPATSFFTTGSTSASIAIGKTTSQTTLLPTQPTIHGQTVSFTAAVSGDPGLPPTGQVQFVVDNANFGSPVTLSGGLATSPSTTTLSTGSHTVLAKYLGDGNYLPSTGGPGTQVVNVAPTTTTLGSSVNPSVHGQPVTFTAHVAVAAPVGGTPTGSVQFDVDNQPYGLAVPLSGADASLTISSLSTGNHTVSATYNGDSNFGISNSADLTQGVGMAASSLAISSSDSTSVTGQPVSFTATLSAVGPGAGTPTGSVQFSVDGVALGDPVTLVDGVATSPSTSALSVGTHDVTADYQGDADFSGSSDSLTQTVDPASTSTTVSSDVNPSVFGQPVTFTANVAASAPGSGTPDGSVQFYVDGVPVGQPVTLVNGSATSDPIADLTVDSHAVTAVYSGSDSYLGSTSDALTQVVNKAASKTTLSSSANPSVSGQPVTFTASVAAVAPGAGSPTGTITFSDGSSVLATVPVGPDTGEQASYTTSALSVAQHAISASYSGDGDFLASTGSVNQTVQRAQTSTVLTSSANPAKSGQSISFTATVTPVAPGAGDPTGTVTFTVNGAPLGLPVQVVNGSATSSAFASLSPGTYNIAAKYSGDHDFVGSSAVLDQGTGQNVSKGDTTLSLNAAPNPATYGQTVTFSVTVAAVAPATGHPSGVVDFYDGDVLLGAASLQPGDADAATASFASSTLGTGSHAIRAVYVGNFNFTGQSASLSEVVGRAASVTGLSAAPNPASYGQQVTLTATVSSQAPGTPTGTVTFNDGSTVLGTGTLTGSGTATLTVPSFEGGAHSLTATYSGDGTFAGSTSPAYTLNVNRVASTLVAQTLLVWGQPGGVEGNGGRVRATLTGLNGAPLPGQTLVFTTTQQTDHSVIYVCSAVTDANGYAECDGTTEVPAMINDGGYDVTFAGNTDYLPSHDHGKYNAAN